MGVLSSSAHGAWAKSRSSTLEDRLRYTPSSVFETFPWPYPVDDDQRERIGKLSRDIIERRQAICAESDIGLTALYNLVDDGAYEDLKALHNRLDEEVVKAYGWPKAVAHDHDEMVRRLLELNREITAAERGYDPFGVQVWAADHLPDQNLSLQPSDSPGRDVTRILGRVVTAQPPARPRMNGRLLA